MALNNSYFSQLSVMAGISFGRADSARVGLYRMASAGMAGLVGLARLLSTDVLLFSRWLEHALLHGSLRVPRIKRQ